MLRKLTIATLVLMFSASTALSQQLWSTSDPASIGIRGGFDMQSISGVNAAGDDVDNSLIPAFNAGVYVEFPVIPQFYLQPAILYTTKGTEREQEILDENINTTVRTAYIEVPVNLLYKPILGNGNLIAGFGPYIAVGINGEAEIERDGTTENQEVKFQNTVNENDPDDAVYYKPFDAGANFLVGYQFVQRFSVQFNVQLGLVEINPDRENVQDDRTSLRNVGFGITLNYRF